MFEFLKKKAHPDTMNEKSAQDAWQSMASREFKIMDLLDRHPTMAIKTFNMMFKSIFPYAGSDMEFEIGLNPEKTKVELYLFHGGNEKLKADEEHFATMMPESLRERWVVHVEESKNNAAKDAIPDLTYVLDRLVRNEISITPDKKNGSITGSRFGGKPAAPDHFEWPRFEAANYNGETADRPLSFLCQINLEETASFDKESLLPNKGLLLFFYQQESACWGFDPADHGCSRVFYFENTKDLVLIDFPADLKEENKVKEYALSFRNGISFPSFDELECHLDVDSDWDAYDEMLEKAGYNIESERHKLLGYANLIQDEILSECERISRGMYCGDAESYQSTTNEEKADIKRAASDWILLFQMASIEDDDYELMFGDLGNLYFYIRKDDLKNKRFENVHFSLQCD